MSVIKQKSRPKFSKRKKCAVCRLYKTENLTMHKMPKNKILRNLWFKAVNKELKSSAIICSNHFKESDYRTNSLRKILKSDAIPTQFNSRDIVDAQSQILLKAVKSYNSHLSNEQILDINSEKHLSNQKNNNSNLEDELCYIYYLDEEQNVGVLKSSVRHDYVENICNSSKSNEITNLVNTTVCQEKSSLNLDFDMTQSVVDTCTEEKSLSVNDTECMTILQNLSLEPYIGLNSSDFTTKHAWQTFCDIVSKYRGQIYDLQDHSNILETKINRLKELLNLRINKI